MSSTTVPLTTTDSVAKIHARFRALEADPHAQPVPGYLTGLLFATGIDGPVTVKVPMVLPDMPNEWSNLLYMAWLATDLAQPITNLSFIDMDVADSVNGDVSFTVFAPDQESPMGRIDLLHPPNRFFAGTQLAGIPVWRGNILHAVHCALGVATSHGTGGAPMIIATA
ncbi:hypothetical protein C8R47DRAFT_1228459 [Mycena vitilis]|nr:hypothetical protein C8R47DRAFT_1228459 [Mycena vitilis]